MNLRHLVIVVSFGMAVLCTCRTNILWLIYTARHTNRNGLYINVSTWQLTVIQLLLKKFDCYCMM